MIRDEKERQRQQRRWKREQKEQEERSRIQATEEESWAIDTVDEEGQGCIPAVLALENYGTADQPMDDGGKSLEKDHAMPLRLQMPKKRPTFASRPRKACPSPFQAGASRILEVGAYAKEREDLLFRKLEMHVEQTIEEKSTGARR